MPFVIRPSDKGRNRCFVRYGRPIGNGRYQCWWCNRIFPNEQAWRRHASRWRLPAKRSYRWWRFALSGVLQRRRT